MKKVYKWIFNFCTLFLFILSLLVVIVLAQQIPLHIEYLTKNNESLNYFLTQSPIDQSSITILKEQIANGQNDLIKVGIYLALSCLALLSCIFIFVYSNPKLFRKTTYTDLSAEWAKNKAERAVSRSAKAEAEKQKQIAELEQKLNELKKDE